MGRSVPRANSYCVIFKLTRRQASGIVSIWDFAGNIIYTSDALAFCNARAPQVYSECGIPFGALGIGGYMPS